MQFTTFVLAALAGSSITSARALARRTVTTTVGLPNADFHIRTDPAAGVEATSVQAFPVDLPATECTLFSLFQPGFVVDQTQNGVPKPVQINVFDVDGNAPGALVGTFTINKDGRPHDINSFQCRDPLTVRFEVAADNGLPGSVSFYADGQNGIFLDSTPSRQT
ncbi:hypothetical protein SLS62_006295 [Diatrype stigma]|uniref:Uncharacterized protein n=1 Tax=Diatrype stigma TaxID=117547 RepID=A0AAN9UMW6_9PEZI